MDGTEDHHVKQNKPVSERQVLHIFSYVWNLGGSGWHESKREPVGEVKVATEGDEG